MTDDWQKEYQDILGKHLDELTTEQWIALQKQVVAYESDSQVIRAIGADYEQCEQRLNDLGLQEICTLLAIPSKEDVMQIIEEEFSTEALLQKAKEVISALEKEISEFWDQGRTNSEAKKEVTSGIRYLEKHLGKNAPILQGTSDHKALLGQYALQADTLRDIAFEHLQEIEVASSNLHKLKAIEKFDGALADDTSPRTAKENLEQLLLKATAESIAVDEAGKMRVQFEERAANLANNDLEFHFKRLADIVCSKANGDKIHKLKTEGRVIPRYTFSAATVAKLEQLFSPDKQERDNARQEITQHLKYTLGEALDSAELFLKELPAMKESDRLLKEKSMLVARGVVTPREDSEMEKIGNNEGDAGEVIKAFRAREKERQASETQEPAL